MTMATINVLLGIVWIPFVLAFALGALGYAVEGIRGQGGLRRWNLLVAFVLASVAWGVWTSIGQAFARASDPRLLSEPADAGSVTAVVVWTLFIVVVLVGVIGYWRSLLRSSATRV